MSKTKSSSSDMEPQAKSRKLDNGEDLQRDIDKNTQEALEQIDSCQAEIDDINEKASNEILKVEQKFNGLRKPLFDRRASIIQKIPNFWMTAMINHPHISILLEEPEEEALQSLKSLEVEECQDIKSGYRIHLHFNENNFFSNSVLTKEFKLGMSGDPKSSSTPIEWKKDAKSNPLMELLAPADNPSQPSSSQAAAQANGKHKKNRRRTFFGWFLDNTDPQCDETAEAIKDDLWPNPLHYYMTPDIDVDHEDDDEDIEDEEDLMEEEDIDEENLEEEEDDKEE